MMEQPRILSILQAILWAVVLSILVRETQARTAFEKMTDVDYQGETYYTIRNLSLYECQGWCREEVECQAASFSFVANSQGQQETVCLLQNGTQANNPTTKPIRALNQYYMVKMSIRSDQVCKRPWNFERVPNSIIQGHDRALIFTSTKEACLAACLNERNFICRSAEYNYVTLQCRLSDYDRRTLEEQTNLQAVELVEAQGVDYFENLCLTHDNACQKDRSYQIPQFGVPTQKVAAHIKTQFYVDKELMANSVSACNRACTVESEFLCRSFLYLGPPTGSDYNCRLYHMDHQSLPDGINTFLQSNLPVSLSNGNRIGIYYENRCARQLSVDNGGAIDDDLGIGSNLGGSNSLSNNNNNGPIGSSGAGIRPPGQSGGSISTGGGNFNPSSSSNGNDPFDANEILQGLDNNGDFSSTNPQENAGGGSAAGGEVVDSSVVVPNGGGGGQTGPTGSVINGNGGSTNNNGGGPGGFGNNNPSNFGGGGGGGSGGNNDFGDDPDINCDPLGTCYDVSVHCKDTRIVVNVNTNKAFSGRIYALGRSETCNVDVINSDSFRLDLTMSGQDCNTQSVAGVYTNTVVVQRHSVVMTKTDKIYKVRCTYDTTSRNITFGMMPIRDPDMISITSAPEAPAPRIRILDTRGSEVETVRIGDRLTFRIEIPDKTPYGIFARSCLAMAKDARSTFEIIDDDGCPVDPGIFPRFTPEGNALVSTYEAFRFTESYGVIFQCNVKYCLGPCQPTSCNFGRDTFESWGKRKKREVTLPANVIDTGDDVDAQMRLSHEIVVLDFGDEQTNPFDFDKDTRGGNATDYRASPMDWDEDISAPFANTIPDDCPERSSVMGLAVACAILVVTYVCTVFCLCLRRANKNTTKVVLPPEHIPGRSHHPTHLAGSIAGSTSSFGLVAHDYIR